jgi:arylsulfatase A-like enzyme
MDYTKYSTMKKRNYLIYMILLLSLNSFGKSNDTGKKPNVIVLFADDLGYGDLGCFGHPTVKTPNLDNMAKDGIKFTSFYTAASVCTPARAALLTGRYPVRSGMTKVLNAKSENGLPLEELTIAELLKTVGYKTGIVGKWHLGDKEKYLPTNQGFDYYFGIPYSTDDNSISAPNNPGLQAGPLPLIRNKKIIELGVPINTLTQRYTEEAKGFITKAGNNPFFLYLAYSLPHVPLDASSKFKGKSKAGLYGDVIEELDWSVGEILELLKEKGISENTIVIFTSDNGPLNDKKAFDAIGYDTSFIKPWHGGSSGLFKGGKFSDYEGGFRVPAIIKWSNNIAPSQTNTDIVTTMDVFTTIAKLGGATIPKDRICDGNDLTKMLLNGTPSPTKSFLFYRRAVLTGVRVGNWKYVYSNHDSPGHTPDKPIDELYDLENDLGENYNVAAVHPEKVAELKAIMKNAK